MNNSSLIFFKNCNPYIAIMLLINDLFDFVTFTKILIFSCLKKRIEPLIKLYSF